jgi:hypothetical protein
MQSNINNNQQKSQARSIARAIPFPTYLKNGKKTLINCPSCKHYDPSTDKCKLFSTNALESRKNNFKCGYSAKYFEPDDIESTLKKILLLFFNRNQ